MKPWWILCAWCKEKVRRTDENIWHDINTIDPDILKLQTTSHGICPECHKKLEKTTPNDKPDKME